MSVDRLDQPTLRPHEHLLAWAFGLSLAFHVLVYGGFHLGNHFGWWKKDLLPSWLKSTKQTLAELKKAEQKKLIPKQPQEPPLLFVEVDPSVSTQDAPKNATHYSNRNSKAGNPDLSVDSQIPKIDGRQTHVPKTQDVPRSQPKTLHPAPPKAASSTATTTTPGEAEKEEKAKPKSQAPGELAMAKPTPRQQPSDGHTETDNGEAKTTAHKRPHTLNEAMAQQHTEIPGEKMKQEGGVRHLLDTSAFDTIATPFGEYDRELVEAIRNHWIDLLDRKEFSQDRSGKVCIHFTLHADGRVTDVVVTESNVGDLLSSVCKLAIIDPAPYAPWPTDMRQYYARDYLDLQFTFWYE